MLKKIKKVSSENSFFKDLLEKLQVAKDPRLQRLNQQMMDVDNPEISQKASEFCKAGDHMNLLRRIYSGLIKVNTRANSLAIQRLCEEIEPDVDLEQSDSSMSDDMTRMLTWEDAQMDVDLPIY